MKHRKHHRRLLAVLLSFVMILSTMGTTAFAMGAADISDMIGKDKTVGSVTDKEKEAESKKKEEAAKKKKEESKDKKDKNQTEDQSDSKPQKDGDHTKNTSVGDSGKDNGLTGNTVNSKPKENDGQNGNSSQSKDKPGENDGPSGNNSQPGGTPGETPGGDNGPSGDGQSGSTPGETPGGGNGPNGNNDQNPEEGDTDEPDSGKIVDFPDAGKPDAKVHRPGESGGLGEEIKDGTLLNKGDPFVLSFVWPNDQHLEQMGIQTEIKYRLCKIPSQIQIDNYNGGITLTTSKGEPFATIYIDEDSTESVRDVYIVFLPGHDRLQSFTAGFSCRLSEDAEDEPEGGKITISLPGGKTVSFPVKEFLPEGPKLEKKGGEITDCGTVTWTVTYTPAEDGYEGCEYIPDAERILAPAKLKDQLPEGMTYVSGSAKANNTAITEGESAEGSWTVVYEEESRMLTFDVPDNLTSGEKVELTYETMLTDAAVYELWTNPAAKEFTNAVRGLLEDDTEIDGLADDATVHVDEEWMSDHAAINKTGKYNIVHGKHVAEWQIVVNTVSREFDYLRVEDTLGKGLELDKDSIKVNGESITPEDSEDANCVKMKNPDGTTGMTLYLYKDGSSVFTPNAQGRYVITYTTTISDDYFQQTPGEGGNLQIGDKDVQNQAKLYWKWKNYEGSGTGGPSYPEEPTIEKNPVKPEGLNNNMISKAGKSYVHSTHTLPWEITLNPNCVNLVSARLEDCLDNDGIVTRDGIDYKLTLLGTAESIQKEIEQACVAADSRATIGAVELQKSQDGRTIGFTCDIDKLGTSKVTFPIQAEIDSAFWSTNQAHLQTPNTVKLSNVQVKVGDTTNKLSTVFSATGYVNPSNEILEKTSASYDPAAKEMTWKLTVNKSKTDELEGVTITDTLPQGMAYVQGSTSIETLQTSETNPKAEDQGTSDGRIEPTVTGQVLTWKLSADQVDGKTVVLSFRAKVDPNYTITNDTGETQPFLNSTEVKFSNTASLKAGVEGAKDTTVTSESTITNPMINKSHLGAVGNKLTYVATLNPHGVKLLPEGGAQLYLTDTMPSGLAVDLESVKLHKAKVATSFNPNNNTYETVMEKGDEVSLKPSDIKYEPSPKGNVFSVPVDDETAYYMTYDAYVVQPNVELTNSLSLEGSVLPDNSEMGHEEDHYTLVTFGGAEVDLDVPESNWKLSIQKVDQDGEAVTFEKEEVDAGKYPASFGLYTAREESAKILEGVCDANSGICIFTQPKIVLEEVRELYLKELRAPTGYAGQEDYIPLTEDEVKTLKSGETVEKTVENIELSGKIEIDVAYNGKTPATPPGFTIYEDPECTKPIEEGIVDENGKLVFDGLQPGKEYYVKQTETPEGYFPDNKVHKVTAGTKDNPGELKVTVNEKIPYKVEHWTEKPDGTYEQVEEDVENLFGILGDEITALPNSYPGFEVNTDKSKPTITGIVKEDGSLVLQIYYDKKDTPTPPTPPKTGDLSISKMVTGSDGETDREFHFTVTLINKSITGTYGDLEFTKGIANFTLKHGEMKVAEDLPVGAQYAVTEQEANQEGYTTSSVGETGSITASGKAASFTNTREAEEPEPTKTGSLTVLKTVTGEQGDQERAFTFTVTLDDRAIEGIYGDMTFEAGKATFTLKHGESLTADGLPAGIAYTVVESDNAGYEVTKSGDTGIIEESKTAAVHFINQKSDDSEKPDGGDDNKPGGDEKPDGGDDNKPGDDDKKPTPTPTRKPSRPGTSGESNKPVSTPGISRPGTTSASKTDTKTKTSSESKKVPKTGDESHMALWLLLMGVSGVGVITAVKVSRKRER